jgi:hypothetical protein
LEKFDIHGSPDRQPLALQQRPLVLMECSVIAERYMGLGYSEAALQLMLKLKERSLSIGGEFTLLWHNSHFSRGEDKVFYREMIGN